LSETDTVDTEPRQECCRGFAACGGKSTDDGYRNFKSLGQPRNEIGAKRHVGKPIHHDLDEDIAAFGETLLDVCSDFGAVGIITTQCSRLDREVSHSPVCVQTKRGRSRSGGERADDGQCPESAGRNAQRLDALGDVEASERMRQTCAADEGARWRRIQAGLCDQAQVVLGLRVADSDNIAYIG
jgi:hypothetical protein